MKVFRKCFEDSWATASVFLAANAGHPGAHAVLLFIVAALGAHSLSLTHSLRGPATLFAYLLYGAGIAIQTVRYHYII